MGNVASRDGGRIDMVDALRGTALIGLFLVHMDEHFELLRYPANAPDWLTSLNQWVHHLTFGLFAGKAYAIFAMMFGISFTLILQSWARKEGDAAARLRNPHRSSPSMRRGRACRNPSPPSPSIRCARRTRITGMTGRMPRSASS